MLLFISNGHGEDVIASCVMESLLQHVNREQVRVLPLVGKGGAYGQLGVKILGEGVDLPSGGFARQSLQAFWADVQAGLFSLTRGQIRILKELSKEVQLGVVVGDIYPLLLGALFLRRPLAFLPTAKSQYIRGHYSLEVRLMKSSACSVFPRDEKTAQVLKKQGVPAEFLGNVMMDAFTSHGFSFGLSSSQQILGILPGSRVEAFQNLLTILPALEGLQEREVPLVPILALAPSLSLEELQEKVPPSWELTLLHQDGVEAVLSCSGTELLITRQGFGDLLHQAALFVGLAGTANEQAAGMGKVVVAFPGEGSQFCPAFLRAQKRLLGEALVAVDPHPQTLAQEVERLFWNKEERQARGEVGQERMGPPGGSIRISQSLLSLYKEDGHHV